MKTDSVIYVLCIDTNIPCYTPGCLYLARESNGSIEMPNTYGIGYDTFPCDAPGCYGKHGTRFMTFQHFIEEFNDYMVWLFINGKGGDKNG